MKKCCLVLLLPFLCGCLDMSGAQQQLAAARARRDAAIQQQMQQRIISPSEGQEWLADDHAHDAAFDQSLITQSYQKPEQSPTFHPSHNSNPCPACEEGREQAEGITSYQSSQPAPIEGIINSYNNPPPASMGIGEGARGWDGRTYIPAGPDPNPPPNVMGR